MLGITLVIFSLILLYLLIAIFTDGRYFGKWLIHWIYDSIGPSIFKIRSDATRWQRLFKELKLRGDERILDVGTAIGDLPLTIATFQGFHGKITGIDWSKPMITTARKRAAEKGISEYIHFEVADVRDGLPFENDNFDVIFCLGLLETLSQARKVLAEFKRVLKPEGTLVLSLYRGWASLGASLSYDWYKLNLSELGVKNLRIVPCRQNQDVVIAQF